MNMPQILKTRCIVNFREKKFRLGEVKKAKSNKIEKNEELITGYQKAECIWNVLPPSHKDINLRQVALTNLSRKFDMSLKLFWKQPLNGILNI